MKNEVKESKGIEITISSLLDVLRSFLIIIALSTVILGLVLGAYTMLFTKTKYSATAKFNVVNVFPETTYIADTMINAASSIAGIYVEAARENVVVSAAVDHNDGALIDYFGLDRSKTIAKVSSMISASKDSADSSIFSITVTSTNKDDVFEVITAIQKTTAESLAGMNNISSSLGSDDLTGENINKITTTARPVSLVTDKNADIKVINPSVVKSVILGALIGFVCAYVICFIIYISDTKVYDAENIDSNFESPIIGTIPIWNDESSTEKNKKKEKSRSRNYVGKLLSEQAPFAVSEAFSTLRTNICYSSAYEKCPVYAITGDFSGAGKSLISVNTAISLSMLGKKTLVIECDLRRPEFNQILKTEVKLGLAEILSGICQDYRAAISKPMNENLHVIYSGHTPPNPAELLGSEKMAELIAKLKEEYDIIIIDTPPVFEVSDACVISSLVNGYIILARSGSSDINALKEGIKLINGVDGKIVGFVLNAVDIKAGSVRGKYYKKYYRYSRYGKYSRYGRYRRYSSPYDSPYSQPANSDQ